jgi:hypothetical protein
VKQLLRFLLLRYPFLWDDGRYRIVGSDGDSITVASADVQLCFTCTRDGVAIDVAPVYAGPVGGRYALETVRALLGFSECLDDAARLRASLPDIEAFFRGEQTVTVVARGTHVCTT